MSSEDFPPLGLPSKLSDPAVTFFDINFFLQYDDEHNVNAEFVSNSSFDDNEQCVTGQVLEEGFNDHSLTVFNHKIRIFNL